MIFRTSPDGICTRPLGGLVDTGSIGGWVENTPFGNQRYGKVLTSCHCKVVHHLKAQPKVNQINIMVEQYMFISKPYVFFSKDEPIVTSNIYTWLVGRLFFALCPR